LVFEAGAVHYFVYCSYKPQPRVETQWPHRSFTAKIAKNAKNIAKAIAI